jgi:hypothetical protein
MKVVKEGTVLSKEAFFADAHVTCKKRDEHDSKGCGARLRIEEKDLVPRYWKASHSQNYYFSVICPRCRHYCHVRFSDGVFEELMTEDMRQRATFDGFGDGD